MVEDGDEQGTMTTAETSRKAAAQRFAAGGMGICTHWLGHPETSADEWRRRVDAYDVEGLADQLAQVGAAHLLFTLGQNSGHYAAPNETLGRLAPSLRDRCASRDLISDLHAALNPRGIKLVVYLPSGAPAQDAGACRALGWEWGYDAPWPQILPGRQTSNRLAGFQRNWESVVREWSLRWGRKIAGWWIDGCYFADAMYRHPEAPNFQSLADALRAGNPDALLAFNPGVRLPLSRFAPVEDYTAGEFDVALPEIPAQGTLDVIPHVLGYLGETWGRGDEPRFSDPLVSAYTRYVRDAGGVVTWDVPVWQRGRIEPVFLRQLAAAGGKPSAVHGPGLRIPSVASTSPPIPGRSENEGGEVKWRFI